MFNIPFLGGNIKINLPFLQWNTLRWDVKTSEAEFEEAKLDLENAVNTALNEVDAQYFGYEKTLEQVANMRRELEADIRQPPITNPAGKAARANWKTG